MQAARELEEVGARIAREAEAARQQALADAKKAAEKAAIEERIQRAKEEEERLRRNAEMERQMEAERKAKAEAEAEAKAEEKARQEKEAADLKKKQQEEAARIKAQVGGCLRVCGLRALVLVIDCRCICCFGDDALSLTAVFVACIMGFAEGDRREGSGGARGC